MVWHAEPVRSGIFMYLPPFADDASVVGNVDFAVLVPSYLWHDVGVESVQIAEFYGDILDFSKVTNLVSDAHDEVYFPIRFDNNLFHLSVPEGVVSQEISQCFQFFSCKIRGDGSCGHWEVCFVASCLHACARIIDVVVFTIVGHHA